MPEPLSRRAFLATAGAAGAGAFLFRPDTKPAARRKPTTTTAAPTTTTTTAAGGQDPYMGPYGGNY